jgi:hypothetical protein
MKKVVITRMEFEEGTSSGMVVREGDKVSVTLDVVNSVARARLGFSEAEFNLFRGLVMKAERAIEESK